MSEPTSIVCNENYSVLGISKKSCLVDLDQFLENTICYKFTWNFTWLNCYYCYKYKSKFYWLMKFWIHVLSYSQVLGFNFKNWALSLLILLLFNKSRFKFRIRVECQVLPKSEKIVQILTTAKRFTPQQRQRLLLWM